MSKQVSLTGIKPTGVPHIGNYFGAIQPALKLAQRYEARYFIADYHALNSMKNPQELRRMIYEVAATWLACGLDPDKVLFYRQSALPETFELSTALMAFTPKGLMNRAHAYKAMVQANTESNRDPDDRVNMGLYTYPVLMAADILLFDADVVPVGKDQVQHLEMTIDIAQSINNHYNRDCFVIPAPLTSEETKTITGLDGRKMSKSYGNTIPMFLPPKQLRKLIMKIITNSQTVEEKKDPDTCNVFTLYRLFADEEKQEELAARYRNGGMGWGDAKQLLFEAMDEMLAPMRDVYQSYIEDTKKLDDILAAGAEKARPIARETVRRIREATGLY
ncbi:MAG: tryptophan--tRNA ligase [Spirochaetales bacterium]|nr:tryptophan--tRNA ligase [Spirochaetales bacterium]